MTETPESQDIDKDDDKKDRMRSRGRMHRLTERTIKGAIIGMIIIVPGISGGTVLLVMGLYEKLMKDLSRLRLMPWMPFAAGMGAGIFISGWLFNWLFVRYTTIILAFLLGCILASIKSVLGGDYRPHLKRVVSLVIGLAIGLVLAGISSFGTGITSAPGTLSLLAGGALASTTMILPGVPGNVVLIIMGIYEYLLQALAELDWIPLIIFAVGSGLGIIGPSNALNKIYARYRDVLNWFFVGLIVGSSKLMIPENLDNPGVFILVAVFGFVLVWKWDAT